MRFAFSRDAKILEEVPSDSHYLLGLAEALAEEQDKLDVGARDYAQLDEVVARLVAAAPTDARTFDFVARDYAQRRESEKGLELAQRAVKLEPGCWRCYDTLALLHYEQHQLAEALAMQTRAVNLLPEHGRFPDVLARLRHYQTAAPPTAK